MIRQQRTIQAAHDAYEDALLRGLCREGALEVAAGVLRKMRQEQMRAPAKQPKQRRQRRPTIRVKRVYEPPSNADGHRVLVDRLWPRGLSREAAKLDEWLKEVAPSDGLRKWYGHDPERWPEFVRRYHQELEAHRPLIDKLSGSHGVLTLLYAAKDTEHNNAVALHEFLNRPSKRRPRS